MARRCRYIIGVLFLLLCCQAARGAGGDQTVEQSEDSTVYRLRQPEEDFLRSFLQDAAFDYTVEPPVPGWWDRFLDWLLDRLFHTRWSGGGVWLDTILKIVAVLLLLFLIYKLIRNRAVFSFGRKPQKIPTGEIDSEEIDAVSYPMLLRKAVEEGNYVLAVRIHYWYILYLMNEKELIRWDGHKTDIAYYHEMKDPQLKKEFAAISWIFNCVCYGDFQVDRVRYDRLKEEFEAFESKITG